MVVRSLSLALLVLTLDVPIAVQNASKLDDPIGTDFQIDDPRSLHPCASGTVVDQVARAAHVLVGFENTSDCWLSPRSLRANVDGETLTGISARQAFDHLIESMPMYSWKELNGVVVVRPKAAWTDPDDLLNQSAQPFEAKNESTDAVLHLVLRAATPSSLLIPHEDVPRVGALADYRMTLAFRGGTILDALNAVVRGHQGAEWQVGYSGHHAQIVLNTLEFPGDSVMTPAALPRPHR